MAVSKSAFARAFQRGNEQGVGLLISEFQRKQALARQNQMIQMEREENRRKERNEYLREQGKQRFEYREGERNRANRLAIAKLQEEGANNRTKTTQGRMAENARKEDLEKQRKMQFDTWVLNNIGVPLEEIKNDEKSIVNSYGNMFGELSEYGKTQMSSLLERRMKLVKKNALAADLYAQGLEPDQIIKHFEDLEKAEMERQQQLLNQNSRSFPVKPNMFPVEKKDDIFNSFGGSIVK